MGLTMSERHPKPYENDAWATLINERKKLEVENEKLIEAGNYLRTILGGIHDYGFEGEKDASFKNMIEAMDLWDNYERIRNR